MYYIAQLHCASIPFILSLTDGEHRKQQVPLGCAQRDVALLYLDHWFICMMWMSVSDDDFMPPAKFFSRHSLSVPGNQEVGPCISSTFTMRIAPQFVDRRLPRCPMPQRTSNSVSSATRDGLPSAFPHSPCSEGEAVQSATHDKPSIRITIVLGKRELILLIYVIHAWISYWYRIQKFWSLSAYRFDVLPVLCS